jgi:hypothetical protein
MTMENVLLGWTSSMTERLLLSSRNDKEMFGVDVTKDDVVVLDHVMNHYHQHPNDKNNSNSNSNNKNTNNNFCWSLYQELDQTKLLHRLQPAKTTGERRSEDLMGLLQEQGVMRQIPSLQEQQQQQSTIPPIRGDKSLFVAREYRQGDHQHDFQQRHPLLYQWITTLSNTIQQQVDIFNLNHSTSSMYHLDLQNTSVQVATYPGDGNSGYVRHRDQQPNSCCQQQQQQQQEEGATINIKSESEEGDHHQTRTGSNATTTSSLSSSSQHRLLTTIYYLVDHDWDETLDGGALRIFHHHKQNNRNKQDKDNDKDRDDQHFDIYPRQDRLVVFRSDRVEHQVLPSLRRPRTAITIWFYGTITPTTPTATQIVTSIPSLPPPLPIISPSPTFSTNNQKSTKDQTIFVSMASYRDSETRPTLDALFATADRPQRIVCGIVLQLQDGESYDETIWNQIQSCPYFYTQQIRYIRFHAKDAMGPCYARGLAQTLWREEDYILQIDSHMRFRRNWDEYLIQQIQHISLETGHSKVMLTTYPLGYTLPNNIPLQETRGTYLVPWKFDDQGMLRQWGRVLVQPQQQVKDDEALPTLPRRQHYLFAGGFNFAPAQVIHDVPYDTMGLPHLFFGEELSS